MDEVPTSSSTTTTTATSTHHITLAHLETITSAHFHVFAIHFNCRHGNPLFRYVKTSCPPLQWHRPPVATITVAEQIGEFDSAYPHNLELFLSFSVVERPPLFQHPTLAKKNGPFKTLSTPTCLCPLLLPAERPSSQTLEALPRQSNNILPSYSTHLSRPQVVYNCFACCNHSPLDFVLHRPFSRTPTKTLRYHTCPIICTFVQLIPNF